MDHVQPDVEAVGVVADSHPAAIAVLLADFARNVCASRQIYQRSCRKPSARDGFARPLAILLALGRVDTVEADAFIGYLDGIAVDDAGGPGNVGCQDCQGNEMQC